MKKFIALLLAMMMVFALCACGADEPAAEGDRQMRDGECVNDKMVAYVFHKYCEVNKLSDIRPIPLQFILKKRQFVYLINKYVYRIF